MRCRTKPSRHRLSNHDGSRSRESCNCTWNLWRGRTLCTRTGKFSAVLLTSTSGEVAIEGTLRSKGVETVFFSHYTQWFPQCFIRVLEKATNQSIMSKDLVDHTSLGNQIILEHISPHFMIKLWVWNYDWVNSTSCLGCIFPATQPYMAQKARS